MLELLLNQYHSMSLAEELHTIAFTVFIIGGGACCLMRRDTSTPLLRPTMSSRRARRF